MLAPLSPLRVVRSGLCIGCGGCVAQAEPDEAGPDVAAVEMDRYGRLQASGEPGFLRRPSDAVARTCPFSPHARNEDELARELFPSATLGKTAGRFTSAYVGYAAEEGFRERGSSGGMVSWMLEELMRRGLVDGVAHIVPTDPATTGRLFRYRVSRSPAEVREGAKSRYYPVEMSEILREIRTVPGRYAVVGVPCFIKAVQLLRREDPVLRERIVFTLGLFCGHMKSARFAESLAMQMGVAADEVRRVEFRLKDPSRAANVYTAEVEPRDGEPRRRDWWNMVDGDWGSGFFQYEACNFCDDVIAETADISFGDAWVEPYASDGQGTNVVVTRSPELEAILQAAIHEGRLSLNPVDEAFVVETQAAGFRQRREGLAYRLTWRRRGIKLAKRVRPEIPASARRRFVYRSRAYISRWSHRVFWISCRLRRPAIYRTWSRCAVALYQGLAYSRGKLGGLADRMGLS